MLKLHRRSMLLHVKLKSMADCDHFCSGFFRFILEINLKSD